MRRVFDANEGLRRRVARCFEFEDLSCADIARVMTLKMDCPIPASESKTRVKGVTGTLTSISHVENPLQGFRYACGSPSGLASTSWQKDWSVKAGSKGECALAGARCTYVHVSGILYIHLREPVPAGSW